MTAHDAAALLPVLARQVLAGTGPIARAHQILAHASQFVHHGGCRRLVRRADTRVRDQDADGQAAGPGRCGKRSTKLALAQRGAARSKMTCSGREVAMAVLVLAGLSGSHPTAA